MKLTIVILVVVIALIQLIPVDRDNPVSETTNEIAVQGPVKELIQQACYDCHSNQTSWPWYSYVAPVSWFIAHDVHEGREKLNFSEWNLYSEKRIKRKLNDISEEIEEKEMPMPIYTIMHTKADLSDEQRKILINWANSYFDNTNPDSLTAK